ncbi:MAG: DUF805 domain-containing protein [Terracidiphilus sp.]|jgi:uncharacterized membrane protein YhaH (DUF805 family)
MNWYRNWYWTVFSKGRQFDGRSRRKEFWMFQLLNTLIILGFFVGGYTAFGTTEHTDGVEAALFIPLALYILATIIPSLAITVRRLHDTGKSGWMILLCLIPKVGRIILLAFMVLDGDPGPNQYGPNPKLDYPSDDIS